VVSLACAGCGQGGQVAAGWNRRERVAFGGVSAVIGVSFVVVVLHGYMGMRIWWL